MPRKETEPPISANIMHLNVTLAIIFMLPVSTFASGPQEGIIYHFAGLNGAAPNGSLIADDAGNLYGVTETGGDSTGCGITKGGVPVGCGTVFELTPPDKDGGKWTESVLYDFQGSTDGSAPVGTLALDRPGNLYWRVVQPDIRQSNLPMDAAGLW